MDIINGIPNQTKFSSQTSELWRNVHGQSCHFVTHSASNSSSDLGVVLYPKLETIPNYTQYIAKKWVVPGTLSCSMVDDSVKW